MQISRFTASKPSKFAFASDEKSIRQPTTSFVRCYLILFPAFACAICLRREFGNSIKKGGCAELQTPCTRFAYINNYTISCIHLRHLLAPFQRLRPLIPLSVALLRCVSFALASAKNSLLILAHSHLEIVLLLVSPEQPRDSAQNPARHLPRHFAGRGANRRILHAPQQ